MEQTKLLNDSNPINLTTFDLDNGLMVEINKDYPRIVNLFRNGTFIKTVDLSDNVAKRLFVVETIELGSSKSKLASALNISRQTIHNYLEIKKYFGIEGLIHGYKISDSKNLQKQRKINSDNHIEGNKAELVSQIRKEKKEEEKQNQSSFNFSFPDEGEFNSINNEDLIFTQEHDWKLTRYAGIFIYLITLISEWKWLRLVMGHFGGLYKIFMIFLFMAAKNIRSIEQLKNVNKKEAGIVLGIKNIPNRLKIREWLYCASIKKKSLKLLGDFFRSQISAGIVGFWIWFTDGHLLPYNGKEPVHYSYSTQRRMPQPGQTNMVTCDENGRIVDFEIQEGKGNLRSHIIDTALKWKDDLPEMPVMVFDREGFGKEFFLNLVDNKIPFVTWEKNVDAKELALIEEEKFVHEFTFNNKEYSVFEEEKKFEIKINDVDKTTKEFCLRRIYIWNKTSQRRTCGLSWTGEKEMSTIDCAKAILSRWGASENTFKHFKDRHPMHYRPGFCFVESEKQDIANPEKKEKQSFIKTIKNRLNKLYKEFTAKKESLNKDGKPRENSAKERLKEEIEEQEKMLESAKMEISQLPDRVDVSSMEDYQSFKSIDNEGKNLFDFVTCSVWNARKLMVDWLRSSFSQENEVVDLFYAITNCHGWVKCSQDEVIVRLEPLQQPKRRAAQEKLCRILSNLGVQTPTGKYMVVEVGDSPL